MALIGHKKAQNAQKRIAIGNCHPFAFYFVLFVPFCG